MATTLRELVTTWGFDIDEKPLRRMDASINGIKSTLSTVGIAIGAVGAAVGGIFLRQAGIFEQAQIAFETMLGSADRAKVLLKDITTFAAKTPFEIQGLIESSKRLLAFGFAADQIIPTMESLGNISAGVGREKLPQLILALGQVRAATKLRGQELRQFTEAGVPLIEEIAKMRNIAEKEVQDLVSRGEVSFQDVNQALKNLTTGSGRFANLMIKQSKSLFGIISNLKDNFTILAIEIGQDLLPEAKKIATQILEWIDANKELLKQRVLRFVQALVKMAKSLFSVLENVFLILKSLTLAFGGLENVLLTLIRAFSAFIALKLAFYIGSLVANIGMVTAAFAKMGAAGLLAQAKLLLIPIAIGAAIAAIALIIEDIVSYFQGKDSITGRIVQQMQKNFPEAVVFIKDLFGFWKEQVLLVVDVFKLIWAWMKKIAGFATNFFKPVIEVMNNMVRSILNFLGITGKLAGLTGLKGITGALQSARDRTSGARDFVQSITPATTRPPGGTAGTATNNQVEIKPVINNTIQGTADPEETANRVNQTIEGNLEKIFREAGRDLTPAIER